MGWFRKKRRRGDLGEAQLSNKAQKAADFILAVQLRWAAKLNARGQKMGKQNTLIILGAVGIGFAAYLVYILVNAIF